jgi:hypothetical protein
MSKGIDELLQDAAVRLTMANKYATELATAGITAEYLTTFEGKIGTLRTANTAFEEAKNRRAELTKNQEIQVKNSQSLIKKFRAAAQITFYGDELVLKEFHIGTNISSSVKSLSTELPYLQELAGRYATELATAGITADDIGALGTAANELVAIDQNQEESKNAQKVQKGVVNESQQAVKEMMFKIKKAAEIVFMNDKVKKDEFKSVFPRKRTNNKATEE